MTQIPHPPERPLVGNALDLDSDRQVQALMAMARRFGDIFSLKVAGRRLVVVSGFPLVDELCDESRFDKRVWAPLQNVRAFAGDGLFTAHTYEPNWKKAHNILLPDFSLASMRGYHPMMVDIARQLVERWQRRNPGEEIDVADAWTRLTLDTIGLCGFGYRFNSFHRDRMHPFIRAMVHAMSVAMDRSARPGFAQRFLLLENRRFKRALDLMNQTVDGIIQQRRAQGVDPATQRDLLSSMLVGRDRESGEALDDLNIRYQIITFLIAGHETTSGLLSFATYLLLQHPEVMARAVAEVDAVLGDAAEPGYAQVNQLRYLRRVLNESLRLWPTAPMFALFPKEGQTVIGGRYQIDKRDAIAVLVPMLHRDPRVWGADAERFDPERFSEEAERTRPANAFKPFGNGQRACIGRQFALHEATLALGMVLQRFTLGDPHRYRLDIQETLTLKPQGLRISLADRAPRRSAALAPAAAPAPAAAALVTAAAAAGPADAVVGTAAHRTPLLVLYGSNMGTAENVARGLADAGAAAGYAVRVASLDEHVGRLPRAGAVLIATSSYNGTPPDNAVQFVRWLEGLSDERALAGVRYAVFGCGHRDWAATYQQVPKHIDQLLAARGAVSLCARGEGDGRADFDSDFQGWQQALWPRAAERLGVTAATVSGARAPRYRVEVVSDQHPNPFLLSFHARPMVVIENRELQSSHSDRSTRHLELALPPGVRYETGDHLGVIAHNDEQVVRRVLERFGFDEQTRVRITQLAPGHSVLPHDSPISVQRLLTDYVELRDPATRAQIRVLAEHTACPPDRRALERWCGEGDGEEARRAYRSEVLERHTSLLDLLEEFPACELPFELYLGMLPTLRPRYYSISSSPRRSPHLLALTVAVVAGRARSGRGEFRGVCSNHLAHREKGSVVHAFVRDTRSAFRLPRSPQVPLLLIGPGTGIAPFRGFLEERAHALEQGEAVGRTILFFGCRHPELDYLYRDELERHVSRGVVELVLAFSRVAGKPKTHVQDCLLEHADTVWELLEQGAVVYVCGDAGGMAPSVRAAFARIAALRRGCGEEEGAAWLHELEAARRYLVDVWAS